MTYNNTGEEWRYDNDGYPQEVVQPDPEGGLTPPLQPLMQFGNVGQMKTPAGVAIDTEGNIWVTDSERDRVQEYSESGDFIRQFGEPGSGSGQLSSPQNIALDSKGDIYVADSGDDRIEEFSSSGEQIRTFGSSALKGGQLLVPSGIALDWSGNVWVLNAAGASGDRIVEFSGEGSELHKFGTNGTGEGQLGKAYGLAISGGNLYVAEEENSRVQEFSTSSEHLGKFEGQFDKAGSGEGESNKP